jgi:hypothetical protein
MATQNDSSKKLFALGISECLMVMPALFVIGVAMLRLMQPREYEPARTSWLIFEWMRTHLSRADAAGVFLVLPAIAFAAGAWALLRNWRENERFRQDVLAAVAGFSRNLHMLILAAGTVAGAAILAVAVVHMITD